MIHEKFAKDPLPEYDLAILTVPDMKGFKCNGCYETACLPTKPIKGRLIFSENFQLYCSLFQPVAPAGSQVWVVLTLLLKKCPEKWKKWGSMFFLKIIAGKAIPDFIDFHLLENTLAFPTQKWTWSTSIWISVPVSPIRTEMASQCSTHFFSRISFSLWMVLY